ncbi:MAG: replication and repair protein RadC protein, partial [Candidatus Azambacteria bacterium GW2011_GWE2_46_45]
GLEELARIKGIGPAKAAQIKAVFELGKRSLSSWDKTEKTKISSAEDVFKLFGQRLKAKKKEHFLVLLLDARNRLIRSVEISVGSLDASIVHPREVFKEAIGESASRLILVHNHPSGDPKPSEADIEITGRLAAAGKILGLEILDHVIIGNKSASSLKEEGLF